ncbi:toxin-antitoxin system YwqK family antitoxin [Nocardia carnea]|uniref:toxin-antitoxin system YwqK family antitoxin n=1 Tax=Nocardia carnea TaxID=37328 RepID=UPI00245388C7|nr:hypothetical protein [Nocardia carnea]
MERLDLNVGNYTIGDDLRLEYDGEPFTGEVVETAAGLLLAQDFYVNGVRHGPSKQWWGHGSLRSEGVMHNGRVRGTFKRWHPNGQLSEKSEFSDSGRLISREKWMKKGTL